MYLVFPVHVVSVLFEPQMTYQLLVRAYCEQGNIEGATSILEYMKEKKLPIGENVFHSLIVGNFKRRSVSVTMVTGFYRFC